MKLTAIFILAIPLFFFGCIKTDINIGSHKSSDSDLVIKAGYECGWGSGTDSLEISQKLIRYVYYVPAKSSEPVLRKSRSVTEAEWAGILSLVNKDEFAGLNYQECNVCFDGCDDWIFIQDGTFSHKITYAKGNQIDSILNLQKKLADLRAEFNQ
ncbi:MAG: hypothetical protein IPJ37_09425 [Bacteroidales bacterium]|nr:hypothetical protein [Bacteroidales bacterium]